MNKKEIFEGNKLIAEFMDGKVKSDLFQIDEGWIWLPHENMCKINSLRYNFSWDWLMPVFDKFTSKFNISWKISSTMVSIYNPNTNINGRFEINCPENIIIDAWRGVISTIKDINKTIK